MTTRSSIAIVNAHVVPVASEVIENGTVLIEDGVITAVGQDVTVPEGTTTIDAQGRWLLPGFVEGHGHIGIHEEGEGWAGNDTNEMTDPNGSAFRALDAIQVDEDGFRDALAGGVTTAVIKPGSGNPIGGQTVAIKTWGGRTVDEQVISDLRVKSALGENPKRVYGDKKQLPSTRLGVADVIRAPSSTPRTTSPSRTPRRRRASRSTRDLGKETLARVLAGELPWASTPTAPTTSPRRSACRRVRLPPGDQPRHRGPPARRRPGRAGHPGHLSARCSPRRSKVELRQRRTRNTRRSGGRRRTRRDHHRPPRDPDPLPGPPGVVRGKDGLPRETALAAITVTRRRSWAWTTGWVRSPGPTATSCIWSGDPLDTDSRAEHVFITGTEVYSWDPSADGGRGAGRVVERSERFACPGTRVRHAPAPRSDAAAPARA